jgi:hypothetical protein
MMAKYNKHVQAFCCDSEIRIKNEKAWIDLVGSNLSFSSEEWILHN